MAQREELLKIQLQMEVAKANDKMESIRKLADSCFKDAFKKNFEAFLEKGGNGLKNKKNDLPDLIVSQEH